jgi:hypothetical protein
MRLHAWRSPAQHEPSQTPVIVQQCTTQRHNARDHHMVSRASKTWTWTWTAAAAAAACRYTALPARQSQPQRAGHRTPDTGQVTPHRFISAEAPCPAPCQHRGARFPSGKSDAGAARLGLDRYARSSKAAEQRWGLVYRFFARDRPSHAHLHTLAGKM